MKINLNTNISDEFNEISIIINAPVLTEEIQNIIKSISNMNLLSQQIMASEDNRIYFIDLESIICFFSKDKYNYIRTKDGIYKVKYKLYELEEMLKNKDFIRISNSCIINIKQVECFDTSIIGTILVKLRDNSQEKVSKRNVKEIMKLLRQRGKLK